ncbi:MAG: hypothetical protein MJ208_02830 [Bacilli bacterium]|nr:hypothetical protein [Bacilli bacterium]
MLDLNKLDKYSLNQIEGELNQLKRDHRKFLLLILLFGLLAIAMMIMGITALVLYIIHARQNYTMYYLAIGSSATFVALLVPFFTLLFLDRRWHVGFIHSLRDYLNKKKKNGKK